MTVKIVVVRHPEKNGDRITPHGAEQAFAAAVALEHFKFERLLHSGLHRAWQTLQVMAAAMDLEVDVPAESRPFLNFTETLTATVRDSKGFFAEVEAMKKTEGVDKLTLAMALRHSEYARLGRRIVTKGLIVLAVDMELRGQMTALAVSHSPWLELAALDPETTPYSVGEADAVVYTVEDGRVVSSELIKAPLAGKSHV